MSVFTMDTLKTMQRMIDSIPKPAFDAVWVVNHPMEKPVIATMIDGKRYLVMSRGMWYQIEGQCRLDHPSIFGAYGFPVIFSPFPEDQVLPEEA